MIISVLAKGISFTPMYNTTDPNRVFANSTITGYVAIGYNDADEMEQNGSKESKQLIK